MFASVIPDPDDPDCPQDFRHLVMELLKHERFRPDATIDYTDGAYGKRRERPVEDTPRNRETYLTPSISRPRRRWRARCRRARKRY